MTSMKQTKEREAVTYCLAGTEKERAGQDDLCRAYASAANLAIRRSFYDSPLSPYPRKGLEALLGFLRERDDNTIVIVDDLARLGSNVTAYKRAQSAVNAAGGIVRSATMDGICDNLRRAGSSDL